MATVEWRPVPGFNGVEASSEGIVRYLGRPAKTYWWACRRYLWAYLGPVYRSKPVHRLILLAFGGAPPSRSHEAAHLDSNRANNKASNLAWVTHAVNMAMDRGNHHSHRGEVNPNAKLTLGAVAEIREAYQSRSTLRWGRIRFSRRYGVSETHILRIAQRKSGGWNHA